MDIELITIGDEILIGQTIDSNSAWMGKALNRVGFRVSRISSISDAEEDISVCLTECLSRVKVVVITGGLGPTKDDVTKFTLAKYFESELVMDPLALARVESFFAKLNRPLLEVNRLQALVPEKCKVLPNLKGTASGMMFEQNGALVFSLPGVPYEMSHLMETQVIPEIQKKFQGETVIHKTIMTQGVGESFLAETIAEWENSLTALNIKLAYLPSPGMVKLRLTTFGGDSEVAQARIDQKVMELFELVPQYIFGEEDEDLEIVVGKILLANDLTVSVAESCTGGTIAQRLTSEPGSSKFFKGGVVSYSNESKVQILGVPPEIIAEYGAVSEQVVTEMATRARVLFKTNYGLATTGIAGPDGGTEQNPVGTIYLAVATGRGVVTHKQKFGSDRLRNIERSTIEILNLFRKELLKDLGN